jgi:hypothetical protein
VNAERLHGLAILVKRELDETMPRVDRLREVTRQSANSPGDPDFQRAIGDSRQELFKVIDRAPSKDLPPLQRDELRGLELTDALGTQLRKRVEAIFRRNGVTPIQAADQLDELYSEIQQSNAAVEGLVDGFERLGIETDELAPGEVELSLLVPRSAVGEGLESLGREFIRIKSIIDPFIELVTGSREEVRVRAIASSEFEVFVLLAPYVGLGFAKGLETVLNIYEKVLNIRKATKELEGTGVDQSVVDTLHDQAREITKREIHEFVERLLDESKIDDDVRRNGLRLDLSKQLMELAKRIDNGYRVDLDARQLPPPEDGTTEPKARAKEREALQEVISTSARLKTFKLTGKPILGLPETTEDTDEDGMDDGEG